jgi:DNA-binding PadR family transcriptional regulator
MRTTPDFGFDLRDALDGIRETFGPRPAGRPGAEQEAARDIRSAILTELAVEPMHGYQLIQAIEARTAGAWTPTAGTVYPTLQLLADEGLVTAAQVGERKVYSLTDAGRLAAADIVTDAPTDEPRSRSGHATVALTKSGVKLAQALTQVATTGTAEQSERAAAIADDARRKLYAILAED